MVTLRPVLALVLLVLAGCAQLPPPNGAPTPSSNAGAQAPLAWPTAARRAVSQIHVSGDDSLRPATLAIVLREILVQRGFDVRGADGKAPAGNDGAAAMAIAHSVAQGQKAPPSARSLTYLHANAPRLLLLVDIGPAASAKTGGLPMVCVGAIFSDTTDGSILWSCRIKEACPSDDRELRRLAVRILATLPPPQS